MYQPILATNSQLALNRYHSNLSTDAASGDSTLTLYSISQFAIDQPLLIGEFGNEGSEIISTHNSTSPSGSTVTLLTTLAKDHPKDTPVYILAFDQIEFSHAATLSGVKSILGSVQSVDPEKVEMIYEDTSNTSGYYFTRYKNSITGNFSNYSDAVPYAGFDSNTVGYAIDTALNETNIKLTDKLTYNMLISYTNQMLRLVRGKLKAWSEYQEFDYDIGNASMGVRSFAMPTTAYDVNSNKSVLNLRLGNAYPLDYIDRSEYLQATYNTFYTEVKTEPAIASVSLVLDSTENLPDTGTINVYVSGTKYEVDFTANTKSTGTLTVATDQITYGFPVDSPVWYNIEEGPVRYYSIWDGYVYPWPMITTDYEGESFMMDFYTDIDSVDSDADVITGPRFDMLLHYLKFKIRAVTENNGVENLNDPSYIQFMEILKDAIRLEETGQINTFRPRYRAIYGGRARRR